MNKYNLFAKEFWGCDIKETKHAFIAYRELKDNSSVLVIYWLWVHCDYRGTGEAKQLFQEVVEFAKETGYTTILADVDTQYGTPMKNLLIYNHVGFDIVNAVNNRITLQYDLGE